MPEPTTEEMLTNVRTAINNALVDGGSIEWEFNGRRVRHDYNQLLSIEAKLVARQSSEQPASSMRTLASFEGRPS